MDNNSRMKYIKCLNREGLIDFLKEQNFSKEAQILVPKDIDGERFLNFSELDLVQWKLTVSQKKAILNCRNTLLTRKTPAVVPKKFASLEKEKAKHTKTLDASLEQNKNIIRGQRVLPALPKESNRYSNLSTDEFYATPKTLIRQSLQYVDMTQGNSEDYVDMNPSTKHAGGGDYLNVSSVPSGSAPKIPERSQLNFNRPSSQQTVLIKQENLHTQGRKKGFEPHMKQPVQENAGMLVRPNRGPQVTSKPPPSNVDETEDYLEPNPIISALESPNHSHYPIQKDVNKSPLTPTGNKCPPVPIRPPRPSSPSEPFKENESIYEAEPKFTKSSATKPTKGSIQNIPLPPIPNQTRDSKSNISKSPPAIPNRFNVPKEEIRSIPSQHIEKPNILPKPPIKKLPENWNGTRPDASGFEFDVDYLPPPPPEFSDKLDSGANAKSKEEPELPRPPMLNRVFEPDHIKRFPDLYEDTSDEDTFNPNDCIYYRNTDRKGAKQLLQKMKNLESDTFLLRPSTNGSYFLGLTIFHDDHYYNLGIHKDSEEKFFCETCNERETVKFNTLNTFIRHYKYNALTVKKKDGNIIELYLRYFLPNDVY